MRRFVFSVMTLFLAGGVHCALAFGLLGPFAPWMLQQPLSYQFFSATGAPMNLGEGYRWNVPVITYAYDQTFLDYFGTNGVTAVESAIQILNNLPPASTIILTNYIQSSQRMNYMAANKNLYDLKSSVLSLLVEQLGLAPPHNSLFCLTNFSQYNGNNSGNYAVATRNYDPITLQPTNLLVGAVWGYSVFFSTAGAPSPYVPLGYAYTLPYKTDPTKIFPTVADEIPDGIITSGPGGYFSAGLTMDDVGGLSYLYNTNNVAMENLIPGVQSAGTNANSYVTKALRPGVDKITFQRMNYVSTSQQIFSAITNQYVDSFFTNGMLQQQTLQRVITQPDILFKANYDASGNASPSSTAFRTSTSNWVNNGAPLHDGPGVIQGRIVINLNRYGPSIDFGINSYPPPTNYAQTFLYSWGSYDGTTNAPLVYPVTQASTNFTTFRFYLAIADGVYPKSPSFYSWNLQGQPNSLFTLQTSTNMVSWVPITTITNLGGTFSYIDLAYTNTPQRFFEIVPQ